MIFGEKNRAKIGPKSDSKRQRKDKPIKNASGDVSGHTFSLAGPFLVDFGVPAGSRKSQKAEFSCLCAAPGAQLFEGLAENASRRPSKRQKCNQIVEHRSKFVEKSIEHEHYETSMRPVCLQNAGVLCQKTSINSEEKRWPAICRASHLRVRRFRASVLNKYLA